MPLAQALAIRTATLSLPAESNILFNSSANIAPGYHLGPRAYADAGYVPHPLQLTGNFPNPAPDNAVLGAGVRDTQQGGVAWTIASPHPFRINGRDPG